MDRLSFFQLLGLSDDFRNLLLTFSLILTLAPYFSGADFGLFKIPSFPLGVKKILKILGPILIGLFIFFGIPVFSKEMIPCGQQLTSKLGQYEGRATILNTDSKLSGRILIEIRRRSNASSLCRVEASVEEFSPLAGQGTLYGQLDPKDSLMKLKGDLEHQLKPKVWDVDMTVTFVDVDKISGTSTWAPKDDTVDPKTYYEKFEAIKS